MAFGAATGLVSAGVRGINAYGQYRSYFKSQKAYASTMGGAGDDYKITMLLKEKVHLF